jgi:hypothetical protein
MERAMSGRVWLRRVAFTVVFVALVLIGDWLIHAERSPLHGYFLWHVAIPNAWIRMNLLPYFLGIAFSGNIHQGSLAGYTLGLAIQWGVIGLLSSLLLVRGRRAKLQ